MLSLTLFSFILLSCEAFDEGVCRRDGCKFPGGGINVVMTIAKADTNADLQKKFSLSVSSMLKFTTKHINLHVLIDASSRVSITQIIKDFDSRLITLKYLEMETVTEKLSTIIEPMQRHFSSKPDSYYSHSLFFLSVALHKVLEYDKIIMLDADLKFNADISDLYDLFADFEVSNIIGIAREAQPVYRHAFHSYRSKHPDTRVGEPPPNGLTGFNSGVLLLDLNRMRNSVTYNKLLNVAHFSELVKEFEFRGHLGDQDFFTLLSMKHEELFYVLPCQWNRQLCQWWRNHGYKEVFEDYFNCGGDVHIYHGNCNTPIP